MNDSISKRSFTSVRERDSVSIWRRDSYLREIVRYLSVSLSLTLDKNEKVEQHIRKKTYKPNVLRFWLKMVSLFYINWTHFSFLFVFPKFPSRIFLQIISKPIIFDLRRKNNSYLLPFIFSLVFYLIRKRNLLLYIFLPVKYF